MTTEGPELLTIGQIRDQPGFEDFSKRQVEYAIDCARIKPVRRAGIIRLFSSHQLPAIRAAVRRTARVEL